MAKLNLRKSDDLEVARRPILTLRFGISLVLILAGVAWIAYYYTGVRPETAGAEATGPAFMQKLGEWNYLVGFGVFFLGLILSAHPATPLGRGRGVVVGMLGCFILGLIWICIFYIFSDDLSSIWIFNDLGQKNLFVGIAFMAVGFAFATRWE